MATEADPIIGNWYQHRDKGQSFEIVAIDVDARLIEIQYVDGDIDEIDLALWRQQDVEPIETPEDWSGPIDNVEPDEPGGADGVKDDQSALLSGFRRDREQWEKYDPDTLQDKRGEGYPDEEPWQDDGQP